MINASISVLRNACLGLLCLGIGSAIQAQPVMSLWKVDEAHLEDHHSGEAYYVACGEEYYINYQGAGSAEDIIISILNADTATEDLILTLPLTLDPTSDSVYEITEQPGQSVLAPGEEAHFVIRYTAPDEYTDAKASLVINSNDPNNGECGFNLDVGIGVFFSKAFGPDVIGPGSTTTLTFTLNNSSSSPVTDLAFTDALPAGQMLASPANATTDCDNAILTAPDGGGTITFTEGRIGANSDCSVSVDVIGTSTATNVSGNLTSSEGNSGSAVATLTVDNGLPGFSKSFSPSSITPGGTSRLTFTIDNTSNDAGIVQMNFLDNLPTGMIIATPDNVLSNCATPPVNPTINATPGSNFISFNYFGAAMFPSVTAGSTCTVGVDVTTQGPGTFNNISENLEVGPDGTPAGFASATLNAPLLFLNKSFIDDPVAPGGTATLEFTIQNPSRDEVATSIAFTDDLTSVLAGLTASGTTLNNICGAGSQLSGTTTLSFTGGTLPAGGSCTFSIPLTVPGGAAPGDYTNTTAAITADIGGSGIVGNMATDILRVRVAPILTKEFVDDPVGAGGSTTLRFTITNTDPTSALSDLSFIDNLWTAIPGTDDSNTPPEPGIPTLAANSLVSGQEGIIVPDVCGSGSQITIYNPPDIMIGMTTIVTPADPSILEFSGGSLEPAGMPGSSCTFDVVVEVPAGIPSGIYTNTTEELAGENESMNPVTGQSASGDLIVVGAPSIIKEFTDDPVNPGDPATLLFTISHDPSASGDATDISFMDDLDAALGGSTFLSSNSNTCGGMANSPGTGLFSYSGGSLSPGESCMISINIQTPPSASPGAHPNTTSPITATIDGVSTTGKPASDDLNITSLIVSKEFIDDPVIAGGIATLRFTLNNPSSDDATNISFRDDLDDMLDGATFIPVTLPSAPCGSTLVLSSADQILNFSNGSVMEGQSCTFDVQVQIPISALDDSYPNVTYNNSVTIDGNTFAFDPATDALTVTSNLIELTKEFTDDPINPGDDVTLEFTMTNTSATDNITFITFSDDMASQLPPGLSFGTVNTNTCGGMSNASTNFNYSDGSLNAGQSCTINITLGTLATDLPGSYNNTTSSVSGLVGSLSVSGDPASDDLQILGPVLLSKSFDGPTVAGGTPQLTFTINNSDASAVNELGFTDNLDAVISGLTSTSELSNTCGATLGGIGTGSLTISSATVGANSICTIVVELELPASATAGTFPNTTSQLLQSGLPVAAPATADLVVEPPPTFVKEFMPATILAGATSKLRFTIDNGASAFAASALDFTDGLQAGVIVATPSGTANTCGGTLTATAGSGVISLSGGSVGVGATCTIDVDVTSSVTGTHMNTTGDLTSSSGNSGTANDDLTVNCDLTNVASIAGTTSVCLDSSPDPEVTFTFSGGLAPYTFTYTKDGGINQMIKTSGTNTSASLDQSTSMVGTFEYHLISAVDSAGCPATLATTDADITVDPLPVVVVTSNTPVCEDQTLNLEENGGEGTSWSWSGPDGFTSSAEDPSIMNVTLAAAGTYKVRVTDANGCVDSMSTIIDILALPTASIEGSVEVCQNTGDQMVTFTGANGTAPYKFTYSKNGLVQPTIMSVGDVSTINQSTLSAETFTYELLSVEDANGCMQDQSGTVEIVVNPLPLPPMNIAGPETICPGLDAIPYTVKAGMFATSHMWSYDNGNPTINGDGTTSVSIDGIGGPGILSVKSVNVCGESTPATLAVEFASPSICVLADCTREVSFIDDPILEISGTTDIFKAIERIESDATIVSGWFKIFRAGNSIEFYPPFNVEQGAVFIAEIEACANAFQRSLEKN